jgi:hypothetical protein
MQPIVRIGSFLRSLDRLSHESIARGARTNLRAAGDAELQIDLDINPRLRAADQHVTRRG